MATSIDEAMQGEWQATHPYAVEVICACGEAWMAHYIDGEPINDETVTCPTCDQIGEPK